MTSASDWISAICSILAGIVGLVTLLTVYLAALQILSRREQYSLGISTKSLGPWKPKVVTPSLLKMQTRISTPTVSLPILVAKKFKPHITSPVGFEWKPAESIPDPEAPEPTAPVRIFAEASWVNFLQALGLKPEDNSCYEMLSEPDLVNGIVPMRWKGRDLVGICSLLGFQSHEDKPSYKTPMPLPVQWSGPLGWLQFRASSDGCIVEYRRRRRLNDRLSKPSHIYYSKLDHPAQSVSLESRLWHTVNGLSLDEDKVLFLGGQDSVDEIEMEESSNMERSAEERFKEVMDLQEDPSAEQIRRIVWGKKSNRPEALSPRAIKDGPSQMPQARPEFFRGITGDILKSISDGPEVQVLRLCPGLLSVVVEGELIHSRGLDPNKCHEVRRTPTDPDEVGEEFKYRLGNLRMDKTLLNYFKEAVLQLKPDGFYFTPRARLIADIDQIWGHVKKHSSGRGHVFEATALTEWSKSDKFDDDYIINKPLFHAMALCNEFQSIRAKARAEFTIDDMGVLSKASTSVRKIISAKTDLIWAMIYSHELFHSLALQFQKMTILSIHEVLSATVESKNGDLLIKDDVDLRKMYKVDLMDDQKFTGAQVLAAFTYVFLTFFWIHKRWISEVALYDTTIPQTVTMC